MFSEEETKMTARPTTPFWPEVDSDEVMAAYEDTRSRLKALSFEVMGPHVVGHSQSRQAGFAIALAEAYACAVASSGVVGNKSIDETKIAGVALFTDELDALHSGGAGPTAAARH
jgi:hypothetical protein